MALTTFNVNAAAQALIVKSWSRDFFKYGLSKMFFSKFIGQFGQAFDPAMGDKRVTILSDPNALIQVKMDLSRERGDTITFPMLAPLSGSGRAQLASAVTGSPRVLEGNEEAINSYSYSITLLEWAHAVRTIGKLMERQPAFSVSDSMTAALGLWWARMLDRTTYKAMAGLAQTDDAGVAILAAAVPTRKLTGGCAAGVFTPRTTDAAIAAGEYMCFEIIDKVRANAQIDTSGPTMRPIVVDGNEMYFMFMSSQQATDLRNDAGASTNITWKEAQLNANVKGRDNPIFRNALGFYRDVALFEYPFIDVATTGGKRTGASTQNSAAEVFDGTDYCADGRIVHRALFCGAQAAIHAYGSMPKMVDEEFQYKTQTGRSLQNIIAIGRPKFNSIDYGVSVVDTAVSA
jgi:N4-gp56 family major capsid protein